jgi:penicillin-binding protein 1A
MAEEPPREGPVPPEAASASERRYDKLKLVLRWAGLTLLTLLLAGVLAIVLVVEHYERELPSVAELKRGYDPPQVTRVLARDGSLLASLFVERRTVIPFSEIPEHVKLSFLAAEDASFYEHHGLNYLGMLRAMAVNLRSGETRQGASTITQQVIKNVVLDASRTYERKIKETILARRLEQSLTKDEIFGLYLNHI